MHASSERTKDSRFLRYNLDSGDIMMYSMYSRNRCVEGDGLAYNELNVLRALVLQPVIYVIVVANNFLEENQGAPNGWTYIAHILGFIFNLLRLALSIFLLAVDVVAWPIRFFLGAIASPFAILLSAGHVYALPCGMIHYLLNDAGCSIVRIVTVAEGRWCERRDWNAGGLGKVCCYKVNSVADASYIASKFKLRQRSGNGPECILVRGIYVFISRWTPWTITNLFWGDAETTWKLLDLTTFEWRKVVFHFEGEDVVSGRANENSLQDRSALHLSLSGDDHGANQQTLTSTTIIDRTPTSAQGRAQNARDHKSHVGKWAEVKSEEDLGTISELSELEEWYNSPLGWNKCHLMRAVRNQVAIVRNDRRALAHVMAMVSTTLFYVQFRGQKEGWLGLSIDLYALVLANYAFVTAYAAEMLVGKVNEVVEAKSERYGVIVTRAIDRGYVRGFHVPNGDWMCYKNGEKSLPIHEVTKTEVNATCNSFVQPSQMGLKIMPRAYPIDLPVESSKEHAWKGSTEAEMEQNAAASCCDNCSTRQR